MHRHAYTGRKLSRAAGPRRALLRGLLDSLILYEKIETTEAKAKELAPYFERQVTRAKQQTLAAYRQILAETINPIAAQKLNTDLVKGFTSRQGGYTRIIKTGQRLGDGAPMAIVELVLDDNYTTDSATTKTASESKKPVPSKTPKKKPAKKAEKETVTTTLTTGKKSKGDKK